MLKLHTAILSTAAGRPSDRSTLSLPILRRQSLRPCLAQQPCSLSRSLFLPHVFPFRRVNAVPISTSSSVVPRAMDPSVSEWTSAEHSMGTSIMAVAFDGGVVLGADSRTTTGSYIANRVSDKITPITPRVHCCRSGSAAHTQVISDYVRYYAAMHAVELGSEPLVGTTARLFRQICYQNKDMLSAGIIVGGYDDQKGGQVYSIPLGGAMVQQPFAIGGSGSSYIYGFCDSNFKEGMSREECIDFVTKSLALAMSRDGSSGGVIRLVVIDKNGVERKFIAGKQLPTFWQG